VIHDDIDTIESGYEFLLAFAAQGRPAQAESGPGPHARPIIAGIATSMKNITQALADSKDDFEQVIASDCQRAGAALNFILAQDKIGSEIVDNLNASIHLRAVLTDLFLYSEALQPLAGEAEAPPVVQAYDATKTSNN
jgi:hypothetical protein